MSVSPATHSIPSQQPPLHVRPPAQLFEQAPVAVHASPSGQLAVVQDE
jgi:hypothetical protein